MFKKVPDLRGIGARKARKAGDFVDKGLICVAMRQQHVLTLLDDVATFGRSAARVGKMTFLL
jgi:hypothetical protein